MARKRSLSPDFFKNEELASIDPLGRILFQGLWCLADRNGNLEYRPMRIKGEILPYESSTEQVTAWLEQLASKLLISFYEVSGKKYINVTSFLKRQSPHPDEKALYPVPQIDSSTSDTAGEEGQRPEAADAQLGENKDASASSLPATCQQLASNLPESYQQRSYSLIPTPCIPSPLIPTPLEPPSEAAQSRKSANRAPRAPQTCDDDWLKELQAKPAYQALNVALCYSKMVAWCEVKGKQPTRPRFINWLNREDVPMTATVHRAGSGFPPNKAEQLARQNDAMGDEWLRERAAKRNSANGGNVND